MPIEIYWRHKADCVQIESAYDLFFAKDSSAWGVSARVLRILGRTKTTRNILHLEASFVSGHYQTADAK